jgi:hypothetical protein
MERLGKEQIWGAWGMEVKRCLLDTRVEIVVHLYMELSEEALKQHTCHVWEKW